MHRYGLYKKLNLVKYRNNWEYNGIKRYEGERSAFLAKYYSDRTEDVIPYGDKNGLIFDEDSKNISEWIKCNDPLWIKAIEQFPYFGMKIVEIPDDVDWELVREYNYYDERYEERIEEKHRTWD